MRRLNFIVLYFAAHLLIVGCEKVESETLRDSVLEQPTLYEKSTVVVEVYASSSESTQSKVALQEDSESGDIAVSWSEGDFLGGYSIDDSSLAQFSMVDISSSQASATFTGQVSGDSYRLIYPYDPSKVVDNSGYRVDLSQQVVDMSDDGLSSMDKYTYLVSDEIFVDDEISTTSPSMHHVGGAIKVSMRFSNLPEDDLIIKSITLGGGSGIEIAQLGVIDLEKSIIDGDALTTSSSSIEGVNVVVDNSPTVVTYDSDNSTATTYSIRVNTLPFALAVGEKLELEVVLSSSNNTSQPYTKTFTISNSQDSDVVFGRSTYTSVNYLCDMSGATYGNWSSQIATSYSGGDGTADSPYLISSASELALLASKVNGSTTYDGKYFKLTNNIDLSANEWSPIGTKSAISFQGEFDGCGYSIYGLYVNKSGSNYQALFGAINSATIKNLTVNGYVVGGGYSGGLVGLATNVSQILYCTTGVTVNASGNYVGAIAGRSTSDVTIFGCKNQASISGASAVGGIVGLAAYENVISLCMNSGDISASSAGGAGGIVGEIYNEDSKTNIIYTLNIGEITSGSSLVGSIVPSTSSLTYSHYKASDSYTAVYNTDDSAFTEVSSKTLETIKSTGFLELLNDYSVKYNQYNSDFTAPTWIFGSDGTPTF